MTEVEWLTSENPWAMLYHLQIAPVGVGGRSRGTKEGGPSLVSPRKLRLWVEACRAAEDAKVSGEQPWANLDSPETLRGAVVAWSAPGPAELVPPSLRAALLRDVVGNPFRPTRSPYVCPRCTTADLTESEGRLLRCGGCDGLFPLPVWLTMDVVRLAGTAYEERGGVCDRCEGRKSYDGGEDHDDLRGVLVQCPACGGTGRSGDGRLDPARLAVLADALEEAGCLDVAMLGHLRGWETCPDCGGYGARWRLDASIMRKFGLQEQDGCERCGGIRFGTDAKAGTGIIPLRGPHTRGCWALDIILGKE